MALRATKKPIRIKISSERKKQLDDLIEGWDFETKQFAKGFLKTHWKSYYKGEYPGFAKIIEKFNKKDDNFNMIRDPEVFKSWEKRFQMTGEQSGNDAFRKIFRKELDYTDTVYLVKTLEENLNEYIVPDEFLELISNMFEAHLKKEVKDYGPNSTKKGFLLVTGPSGVGKTHTIKAAIEKGIFNNELRTDKDFDAEKDKIAEKHPVRVALSYIPFINMINPLPGIKAIEKEENMIADIKKYRRRVKWGIFKKHAQEKLEELEANLDASDRESESMVVDYDQVSPNDVQTMWYGETGNKFEGKMGNPEKPSIRHVLEAHGVLGKPSNSGQGSDVQSTTLSATVNKIMDQISDGERDCIFIADTHSPENLASDTYRRFDELGMVVDMTKFWRNKEMIEKLINLESRIKDIKLEDSLSKSITDKVYSIFEKKNLAITPAYVRKLVSAIIEKKGDLELKYFSDDFLVRNAFENVARNLHGELFKKIVKHPKVEEGYDWDDYVGPVKSDILEMVMSTLLYEGDEKGVVLAGGPGTGKTYLTQVIAATHPELSYLSVKLDDLQGERGSIEEMIDNIDALYNIGKMLAPSLIIVNEGDAAIKQRSENGTSPYDKITNKWLDILDGDESIKGTYTMVTTNFLESLDKALTRPGRLQVRMIDGKLGEKDIYKIIERELGDEPMDEDMTMEDIFKVSKSVNNVPAGYVTFARKLKDLKNIDINVIKDYKKIYEAKDEGNLEEFIKFNAKTLVRVVEVTENNSKLAARARKDAGELFKGKDNIYNLIKDIEEYDKYTLKKAHLNHAKEDLLKNPAKKALKGLDEFLTQELSTEPQVGKICGAAYTSIGMGMLVPINTNLVPKAKTEDGEQDVIMTGVIKASALQQVDYSEMSTQSAREALTLNMHYFQKLFADDDNLKHINASKIIGKLLKDQSIHHQMESVNYMGGGPSAGFALAINTLSVLLDIPVYHDFGITGAPGTKGTSKDKVGSSVMIGGEDQKSERILQSLRRMFVPAPNYGTIPIEVHEGYWNEDKIVIPVNDYRDIMHEVLYMGNDQDEKVQEFIKANIEYNKKSRVSTEEEMEPMKKELETMASELKNSTEFEIKRRLVALNNYFNDKRMDPDLNLETIFDRYDPIR